MPWPSCRQLPSSSAGPVVTSPLGKGAIDETLPLSLGRHGTERAATRPTRPRAGATSCWRSARASTTGPPARGSPGPPTASRPTRLIHVDIDPAEIGRNYPVEVGILGDAGTVLRQLIDEVRPYATAARERHAAWVARGDRAGRPPGPGRSRALVPTRRHPSTRAGSWPTIGDMLPEDAIVLSDIGIHHNWLIQQMRVPPKGRFLQGWGFAAMGFGVAGALGAQFAMPGRPVVAVCGDGGFLMTAERGGDGRGVRPPDRVDRLEQQRLRLDPWPAGDVLRTRSRDRHPLPPRQRPASS